MNPPDTPLPDRPFDVALSYASDDAWLARDIHGLITRIGYLVYCYDLLPDHAHGTLRPKLRDIYYDARLNVLLWSQAYQAKLPDSFVGYERRCIADRHVERADSDSLLIVRVDSTPLERDFQTILGHGLQREGVLGLESTIISRLKRLYSHPTEFGMIHHPPGTETDRGQLTPCTFRISLGYEHDRLRRWERLSDILVEFPNPMGTAWVYLIPSGLTTPLLRHPARLTDPSLLVQKRRVSKRFAEANIQKELRGFWFSMRVNDVDVATIYCPAYDRALNESFSNGDGAAGPVDLG